MRAFIFGPALICAALAALPGPSLAAQGKGKSKQVDLIVFPKKTFIRNKDLRSGSRWFLSHAEFLKLDRKAQKNYIRDVKKIMGSLPTRSATFASNEAPGKRQIASDANSPLTNTQLALYQAKSWAGERPMVAEYTNEKRKAEFEVRWENSMWWTALARTSLAKIPDTDPQKSELSSEVADLERFYLAARPVAETSFAKKGELKEAYAALEGAKAGEITIETPGAFKKASLKNAHDMNINWNELRSKRPLQNSTDDAERAKEPEAKPNGNVLPTPEDDGTANAEKPAADPKPVVDAKPAPEKNPEQAPTAEPEMERFYRCMYSGFVIKSDPCKGPQELPEDIQFKDVDSAALSCDDGQVLCNPLLFGLKLSCALPDGKPDSELLACLKTGKPLCLPKHADATFKCADQSKNEGHLASAAALIRMNSDVWNDYLVSFYELCDDKKIALNDFTRVRNGEARPVPESTKADVERTCKNAKVQLSKLAENHRVEIARSAGKPANGPADGESLSGDDENQK